MLHNIQSAAKAREMLAAANAKKSGKPGESTNKFRAESVRTATMQADSRHEANWIQVLLWAQRQGHISDLKTQKRDLLWALDVNGTRIADYEADSAFICVVSFELSTFNGPLTLEPGQRYVLDAKSTITRKKREYIMKRDLMRALHKIEIVEV